MNLAPMRYKNYVWPHNPKIYEITYQRSVNVNKVPFGRYMMTNLGRSYRVLKGEGEFVGEGAYDEFKMLATVFYEETPGTLIHPVWQVSNAYFVALSLKQEPYKDYVSYTFEFWEQCEEYIEYPEIVKVGDSTQSSSDKKTHTVVSGDTMWAIAKKNGIALSTLIALNPQIKNPNRIYPGDIIYLA